MYDMPTYDKLKENKQGKLKSKEKLTLIIDVVLRQVLLN